MNNFKKQFKHKLTEQLINEQLKNVTIINGDVGRKRKSLNKMQTFNIMSIKKHGL